MASLIILYSLKPTFQLKASNAAVSDSVYRPNHNNLSPKLAMRSYRPTEKNWISIFSQIQEAWKRSNSSVISTCSCPATSNLRSVGKSAVTLSNLYEVYRDDGNPTLPPGYRIFCPLSAWWQVNARNNSRHFAFFSNSSARHTSACIAWSGGINRRANRHRQTDTQTQTDISWLSSQDLAVRTAHRRHDRLQEFIAVDRGCPRFSLKTFRPKQFASDLTRRARPRASRCPKWLHVKS